MPAPVDDSRWRRRPKAEPTSLAGRALAALALLALGYLLLHLSPLTAVLTLERGGDEVRGRLVQRAGSWLPIAVSPLSRLEGATVDHSLRSLVQPRPVRWLLGDDPTPVSRVVLLTAQGEKPLGRYRADTEAQADAAAEVNRFVLASNEPSLQLRLEPPEGRPLQVLAGGLLGLIGIGLLFALDQERRRLQ